MESLTRGRGLATAELAEAIALTQDFAQVVRQGRTEQLDTWLERATQCI